MMSVAMKQPFLASLPLAISTDKVEYWCQGLSKCSPKRYSFGTSQIMYSRIAFCSCDTRNLLALTPFGEHMTPLKYGKCPNIPWRKMGWSTGRQL